jgi:hypothetical protein
MWVIVLFAVATFIGGWSVRGVVSRRKRPLQAEEPELMWFDGKKSRWERVTSMQLSVADKVVVRVPVSLIKQSEEYEPLGE